MYQQEVARGAKWLDEHSPGWHTLIDTNNLNMKFSSCCILGQLGYTVKKLFDDKVKVEHSWCSKHWEYGFTTREISQSIEKHPIGKLLTDSIKDFSSEFCKYWWLQEIKKRTKNKYVVTYEVEASSEEEAVEFSRNASPKIEKI